MDKILQNHNPTVYNHYSELPSNILEAIQTYVTQGITKEELDSHLSGYSFVFAEVPTNIVKKEVMSRSVDLQSEFGMDFDLYHKWYMQFVDTTDHGDSRWPSILSPFADELFQDGWHRFHSYIEKGYETIPIVEFVRKEK